MNLKLLILLSFSAHVALAENAVFDIKNCNKESVAQAMRDLAALQTAAKTGMPPQKTYDDYDKGLSRMPPSNESAYGNVKDKVYADGTDRAEKISAEMITRYREAKKEIVEGKVSADTISAINRISNAYNVALPQLYLAQPKETENTNQSIIRAGIGITTHRIFVEKVTKLSDDLLKDLETKCIPPNLPRGTTLNGVRYRMLYCVDPKPGTTKDINDANGKQEADECRTFHSCGMKTMEDNPNPDFREVTMSYGCKKVNNECPDAIKCFAEAAKKITDAQTAAPAAKATTNSSEGAQH